MNMYTNMETFCNSFFGVPVDEFPSIFEMLPETKDLSLKLIELSLLWNGDQDGTGLSFYFGM